MDPFRDCDVRGIYPDEVNEALFSRLGKAIASELPEHGQIIVGCDARPSSPALKRALTDGLLFGNIKVLDAGTAPTPMVAWGHQELDLPAAIVTASHNPVNQNGLKLILRRGQATRQYLMRLRDWTNDSSETQSLGSVERLDLCGPYVDHLAACWRPTPGRRRACFFVLDPGNGAWGSLANGIFQRVGLEASAIHEAAYTGAGPSRSFDCAEPGALAALGEAVRKKSAAAGFAWDGDGDRVAVCDELGQPVSTDKLALLLLPRLVSADSQESVLLDVKMSSRVHEAIRSRGAVPVVERSAHCMLEARMIAENCIAGFECSGHVFFRDLGGHDDGMYAALLLAQLITESDYTLSTMVQRLPRIFITPDIRIPANAGAFAEIEQRVVQSFGSAQICRLDGVKVTCDEGWFLIRPSVSENKICFRLEGDTQVALERLILRLSSILPSQSAQLASYTTSLAHT